MELSVYKIDGTESGKKVTLDSGIFGIEPNFSLRNEVLCLFEIKFFVY